MFAGLAAAARECFEPLLEIRVELPWPDPRGGQLFARVRPHDTTGFLAVRKALKIEPRTTFERQTDATKEARRGMLQNGKGRGKNVDGLATISGMLDSQGVAAPLALALGFDVDRAYYTPDEVDKLRVGACRELVVAIEHEVDGEVLDSAPGLECEAWFLSDVPIPYRFEEDGEPLRFAGESEGRALTAQILKASMEDERFRRRLVPLGSSLPTSEAGADELTDATSSEAA